jgi:acyl-homoserine-lactone acylase
MIEADLQKDKGYTPIKHGNSFIQVISWDESGKLDPRGMLTYSQSQEPESAHYEDLTHLYANGEWIRFPFYESDIQADPELRVLELSE